jgi:hypothetical protein
MRHSIYLESMEYRDDYTLADIREAYSAGFEEGYDYGFDQGVKEPRPGLLDAW